MMLSDKAAAAIRAVRESKEIAYDTEGSGLDWKRNRNVGYVITPDDKNSFYIPVRHGGGGNLVDPTGQCSPLKDPHDKTSKTHPFEIELAKAFKERQQRGFITIGHNMKFDLHMSANEGIDLGRDVKDTQFPQALLDENTPSYSLEAIARIHDAPAKKGDELYKALADKFGGKDNRDQMGNFWQLPGNHPIGVDYSEGDGFSTLGIWRAILPKIAKEELNRVHDLEQNLIRTTFKMERRGMAVDEKRLEEVRLYCLQAIEDAKRALPDGYNVKSNPQTKAIMEAAGYTDWPLTPAGNPSFPEKWLKRNPLGKAIVARRKMETLIDRYVMPVIEKHLFEGKVHCSLHQLRNDEFGVIAGRYSCSDPNLQAQHKRDKELARIFRSIYKAERGYDFYEGDYSQAEPRLFAHYSEDPNLVRGYNSEPFVDVHAVTAEMLHVERDPTAKRMNMGIFTGMYPEAFAGHMDWDLERATEAWNSWFNAFPAVRDFQDAAKATMRARGYVKTLLGRRCRITNAYYAYRATSRIIQGGSADILKQKLLDGDMYCERVGEDTIHLLLTIHDSFDWQASKDKKGQQASLELARILADVQKPFGLIVPFVLDWKKGSTWAEATYGSQPDKFSDLLAFIEKEKEADTAKLAARGAVKR